MQPNSGSPSRDGTPVTACAARGLHSVRPSRGLLRWRWLRGRRAWPVSGSCAGRAARRHPRPMARVLARNPPPSVSRWHLSCDTGYRACLFFFSKFGRRCRNAFRAPPPTCRIGRPQIIPRPACATRVPAGVIAHGAARYGNEPLQFNSRRRGRGRVQLDIAGPPQANSGARSAMFGNAPHVTSKVAIIGATPRFTFYRADATRVAQQEQA